MPLSSFQRKQHKINYHWQYWFNPAHKEENANRRKCKGFETIAPRQTLTWKKSTAFPSAAAVSGVTKHKPTTPLNHVALPDVLEPANASSSDAHCRWAQSPAHQENKAVSSSRYVSALKTCDQDIEKVWQTPHSISEWMKITIKNDYSPNTDTEWNFNSIMEKCFRVSVNRPTQLHLPNRVAQADSEPTLRSWQKLLMPNRAKVKLEEWRSPTADYLTLIIQNRQNKERVYLSACRGHFGGWEEGNGGVPPQAERPSEHASHCHGELRLWQISRRLKPDAVQLRVPGITPEPIMCYLIPAAIPCYTTNIIPPKPRSDFLKKEAAATAKDTGCK